MMISVGLPAGVLLTMGRCNHVVPDGPSAWAICGAGRRAGDGREIAGGEFLAAPLSARAHWREIADVIWCPGAAVTQPGGWLRGVLGCHPGCAVAAVRLDPRACAVATRAGGLLIFSLPTGSGRVADGVMLTASITYAWLAAGWPVTVLDRARMEVAGDVSAVAERMSQEFTRVWFSLSYAGPGPELGASPDW